MTRPLSLQLTTRRKPPPAPLTPTAPSPIARLIVLAHAIEHATETGTATRAQIARALGLTRARITQIANLAFLAPDLQATLAEVSLPFPERCIRGLATRLEWDAQRHQFRLLVARAGAKSSP